MFLKIFDQFLSKKQPAPSSMVASGQPQSMFNCVTKRNIMLSGYFSNFSIFGEDLKYNFYHKSGFRHWGQLENIGASHGHRHLHKVVHLKHIKGQL